MWEILTVRKMWYDSRDQRVLIYNVCSSPLMDNLYMCIVISYILYLQRAECRVLYPSVLQRILTDAGKIGKVTVDLLCRPKLATAPLSRNVSVYAKRAEYALRNLRRRNRTKVRVTRRQMMNALRV